MANIDRYLGKGLVFPVQLTPQGLPIVSVGPEVVRSSIQIILSWPFRSRMMKSSFGSRIEELLEEPNDDLMKGLLKFFIYDSLGKWEKRIDVLEVSIIRTEPQKVNCEITYRIKTSGLEDVLTFPYYTTLLK